MGVRGLFIMKDIYLWIAGAGYAFICFIGKVFWDDLKAEKEEQAILRVKVVKLEEKQDRGLKDLEKLKEQHEEDKTTISKLYTRISTIEAKI